MPPKTDKKGKDDKKGQAEPDKKKGAKDSSNKNKEGAESNEVETEEFDFYYKFAKTLVLKLMEPKDCALGAQWLKLLGANRDSKGAVIGVKLLILCLNRGFLSQPFDQPAPSDLCMFENEDLDEMDIAQMFLSVGRSEGGEEVSSNPPITTSLSSDFCQYVAVQEIPRFGIHCYFATSPDSIGKWNLPPGRRVLDADIANPLAWEKCMAKISACIGPINKH